MRYYIIVIILLFFSIAESHSAIHPIPAGVTEFVVRRNYNLKGGELIIPEGCKLVFKRGSIRNGTIYGNNTQIERNGTKCILHDCNIEGVWDVDNADSRMFDKNLNTESLLENLSKLSHSIVLYNDREYVITRQTYLRDIEKLTAGNNGRTTLRFITADPNVDNLIIEGHNVEVSDIDFIGDYESRITELEPRNKPTVGNLMSIRKKDNEDASFKIERCIFSGGTSSSYIASSTISKCDVRDCCFKGYMADHAVYCSTKIDTFSIQRCRVEDVPHTNALFKVRASLSLKEVQLSNIQCRNVNGYLGQLSLMNNEQTKIKIDSLHISKDENDYIMYGVCMNCDPSADPCMYNAGKLSIENSYIGYGYEGNSFLYQGGGIPARIKSISYDNTKSYESGFSGCKADTIRVANSGFYLGEKRIGSAIDCKHLLLNNTIVQHDYSKGHLESVFIVNYGETSIESISINNSKIASTATHLIKYYKASQEANVEIGNSDINIIDTNFISAPPTQIVNFYYVDKSDSEFAL